ncbi:MAG: glycosyltransferase family 2 protein [Myxococcota bacterium]|nr:glycosyltransferase family 2 protein [Myxococcota bacterium]
MGLRPTSAVDGVTLPILGPTAVIVTHRGGPLLDQCINALLDQTLPPCRVIVVVSSRSTRVEREDIEVLHMDHDAGFAHAANVGLRAVGSGDVVLLNDDTLPHRDFVESLVRSVDEPGVYQPRILLADGSGRVENTGHRLFPDGFNLARGRGSHRTEWDTEVGAFSGAAVLLTEEVRQQVGLFDGDFEAFGEDLDLSLRARRRGFRIRYVPQAQVLHQLGASYGRNNPHKVFLVERNRFRAAVRSLPTSALVTMPAWTLVRLLGLAVAATVGRGPGAHVGPQGALAAAAGGLSGLLSAPDAWRKRRQDQPHWTTDDRAMWKHLVRHRVRTQDLWSAL